MAYDDAKIKKCLKESMEVASDLIDRNNSRDSPSFGSVIGGQLPNAVGALNFDQCLRDQEPRIFTSFRKSQPSNIR